MISRVVWAALATGVLTLRVTASTAQAPAGVRDLLLHDAGLSAADVDAVSRGEIVTKALATADQRDVAVIAVARVDRRARALLAAPHGTAHLFARPASLADVQAFSVTHDDVDELRKCGPNACNLKLPASVMAALRATIDSAAPDASDRVTSYVRQRMVDYVNAYRARGAAAMVVYDDLGSVQSSAAFDAMIRDSSRLFRVAPALARYVNGYPHDSLPGATSTILWSVDAMSRLRPVMRIMHRVVYEPTGTGAGTTYILSKQLYADHYFEAGLEALMFTDAANAGFANAGTDVVAVETRRYRFDNLPSGGLLDLRGRVIGGLRATAADDMKKLREDASRGTTER